MSHHQVYITVDSAERENPQYTSPAEYVYRLPYTIRNAMTIELMMFQMTRAETNIHNGNNSILVMLGSSSDANASTTSTVYFPEGEVTSGTALAVMVQDTLHNVDTGFTASFNSAKYRLTISHSSSPFSLSVSSGMARVLGIIGDSNRGGGNVSSKPVVSGNGSHSIIGTRAVDLAGEPYILMNINDYDRNTGMSAAIDKSFLMIPLENKPWMNRFVMCNDEKEKKGMYMLTGNQTNMANLRLRFTRSDGMLYDFGGIDHQIVFRITRHDKDYTT
jgi:hypothetical protein